MLTNWEIRNDALHGIRHKVDFNVEHDGKQVPLAEIIQNQVKYWIGSFRSTSKVSVYVSFSLQTWPTSSWVNWNVAEFIVALWHIVSADLMFENWPKNDAIIGWLFDLNVWHYLALFGIAWHCLACMIILHFGPFSSLPILKSFEMPFCDIDSVTPVSEMLSISNCLHSNWKSHRTDALDSILIIKRLYFSWSQRETAAIQNRSKCKQTHKMLMQYRAHIPHSKGDYVVFVIHSTCFFFQLLSKGMQTIHGFMPFILCAIWGS